MCHILYHRKMTTVVITRKIAIANIWMLTMFTVLRAQLAFEVP